MTDPNADPDFINAQPVREHAEELPPSIKGPQFPIQMDRVDTLEIQNVTLQLQQLQLVADKKQRELADELQALQKQHTAMREKFDRKVEHIQQKHGVDIRKVNITAEGLITGPLPGPNGG